MPETAYRLSIDPAFEAFRPEIEHVCDFLDGCYRLRRVPEASRVLHYGDHAPADALTVPAALFCGGVTAASDGLHPLRPRLAELVAGTGLMPQGHAPHGDVLGYDAIGLIFFMLSRLEERDCATLDRYRRFPVTSALVAPKNGRLFPYADTAARDLAAALTGSPVPVPRSRYEVRLTHDVDILKGYHRPLEPVRNALGDILKRGRPDVMLRRLHKAYFYGDPWTSFRRLMDRAERYGTVSRFNFMGPTDEPMDSPYMLAFPTLAKAVAAEVSARGHVIGFHPGFRTPADEKEWRRQHDGLQRILDIPVREGRHHTLQYDVAVTPRIWSDAGMAADYTLAYPEVVGFRSGTCHPHHAYDLVARRSLPLMLYSTAVMEFGLFGGKYRDVSLDEAVRESLWAADICRQFNGSFVLLIHTGHSDEKIWNWLDAVMDAACAH